MSNFSKKNAKCFILLQKFEKNNDKIQKTVYLYIFRWNGHSLSSME